jgi:hypothetical protein
MCPSSHRRCRYRRAIDRDALYETIKRLNEKQFGDFTSWRTWATRKDDRPLYEHILMYDTNQKMLNFRLCHAETLEDGAVMFVFEESGQVYECEFYYEGASWTHRVDDEIRLELVY